MKYLIGTAIKEVRIKKGVTVEQLSMKTGLSTQHIYAIESERKTPPFSTIKTISEALDYSLTLLILSSLRGDTEAKQIYKIYETFISLNQDRDKDFSKL